MVTRRSLVLFLVLIMLMFLGTQLCLAVSRHLQGGETRDIEEPREMERLILRKVPVGASVTAAEQYMKTQGFDCSRKVNAEFGSRSGIDYLYCDRREGWLVQRRWQIAVIHRDGRVTEVEAGTGLVGP